MTLRRELPGIPGVIVRARPSGGQQHDARHGRRQPGRRRPPLLGRDPRPRPRRLEALAQDVKTLLDSTPGIADSRVRREEGRPEIAVRVDRDKAAMLGLTVTGVANTIRTNLAGTQAAMFREAGNEYPIVVRLRERTASRSSSVGDVLLSTPRPGAAGQERDGDRSRAGPGADRAQEPGAHPARQRRSRNDAQRGGRRGAGAAARDAGADRTSRSASATKSRSRRKSFRELQLVLILAIVLVYTVMASQYESLRDPFIIMFSIPLAAIGVVGALLLTSTPFSMQAYIGVIMLAGIVVSNAILLVDYTNTLRHRDKMELRAAIELAGRHRLRPILMTSVCTMLGLVPMALGIGEGAELQVPLARVVIGGLLTSTLITLVFVPAMYTLFEEGWRGLFKKGDAPAPAAACGPRLSSVTDRSDRSPDRSSPARFPRAARARRAARGIADAAPAGPVRQSRSSPYRIKSRSSVRGAIGDGRSRPAPLDLQQLGRAGARESAVSPTTAPFRKRG